MQDLYILHEHTIAIEVRKEKKSIIIQVQNEKNLKQWKSIKLLKHKVSELVRINHTCEYKKKEHP